MNAKLPTICSVWSSLILLACGTAAYPAQSILQSSHGGGTTNQHPATGNLNGMGLGSLTLSPNPNTAQSGPSQSATTNRIDVVWIEDTLPTGAVPQSSGGDAWTWVSSNPTPFSGALAHRSAISAGAHQHFFDGASATLMVSTGETVFAYVYLDPTNPPTEAMLQWYDGSWEHRAYWGADNLGWGTPGTASHYFAGPLPATGQWVRLEIPASAVGLEGRTLSGMAFTLYDGKATWDYAGKTTISEPPPVPGGDTVWFDDDLPAGAGTETQGGDVWSWITNNPAPYSGTRAHQSLTTAGLHQHFFTSATATMALQTGDSLIAYVYLDPANVPAEVMLQWNDGGWEHRAYWGANLIDWGVDGTVSRHHMGAVPAAGQWVRLEVPASAVGLEGRTVSGMAFTLYNGRATWDYAGKSGAGGGGSGLTSVRGAEDEARLQLLVPGDHGLRILSTNLLELVLINTKDPDPGRVDTWDWVDDNAQFVSPDLSHIQVKVNGQPVSIASAGFKRRPRYAALWFHDVRIANQLYLQLNSSIADGQQVEVTNDGSQWSADVVFSTTADPLRYSPAIHVNQEGYVPAHPKKAIVGYYLGNLGEMTPSSANFSLVNVQSGATVFSGSLTRRQDVGYTYSPAPYQNVYEADFTSFTSPGEYLLVVPGMGASLPFLIDEGVEMAFARTYAQGLFHQRSGFNVAMPFTRFTHAADHTAPAFVPTNASAPFVFTWTTVSNYVTEINNDNPPQIAPQLTGPEAQLYPFVQQGSVDTTGGHFEAADYSKVTYNSAQVVHALMFAADSLPGVGALDNLGLPESGDGISDVLQEAKWEADCLLRMQDSDGGFYYAVYPINREYENDVLPENGDPYVVWPKNTVATASAVAALAQCASSPLMKQSYPADAANYLAKAQLGWKFLTNAIAVHGLDGAYQKLQHFGDDFTDRDELSWAACEMFLATSDPAFHQALKTWFPNPVDPSTFRWGWWRMYACYGNAIRSYAFAVKSGRMQPGQLDSDYFARCINALVDGGQDQLVASQDNAYGTSFPETTKRVRGGGWYFSAAQAFDLVVAQQFNPGTANVDAIIRNLNYEGGCNPVNVTYVTGLGWKRQREVVDQYSANDRRRLPKNGVPIGNIQVGFPWTWLYGAELTSLTYPYDGAEPVPYPYYDRWCDFWNVTTEASTTDTVRGFATAAWLAAQSAPASRPWSSTTATINTPIIDRHVGDTVTVTLQVDDTNLGGARVIWEALDQEPTYGNLTYTFTPTHDGQFWIEAEVQWPDGRRAFGVSSVSVLP